MKELSLSQQHNRTMRNKTVNHPIDALFFHITKSINPLLKYPLMYRTYACPSKNDTVDVLIYCGYEYTLDYGSMKNQTNRFYDELKDWIRLCNYRKNPYAQL